MDDVVPVLMEKLGPLVDMVTEGFKRLTLWEILEFRTAGDLCQLIAALILHE